MADTRRPTSETPGLLYAALRVFDLSISDMLWSRRTVFMGLVVGMPVLVAVMLRLVLQLNTQPITIHNAPLTGPDIFGLMIWTLFVRFCVPILGVFYGTSLIADEVEAACRDMVRERPDLAAILLECSLLPPYAKRVQDALGLPVFDFISLIDYAEGGTRQRHYVGRY